jgi:hypothetical protein
MSVNVDTTLRKIWSGVILLVIGTLFAYVKGDIPPNYAGFLNMLFFGFVVGNGFEHYTNMKIAQSQLGSGEEKE